MPPMKIATTAALALLLCAGCESRAKANARFDVERALLSLENTTSAAGTVSNDQIRNLTDALRTYLSEDDREPDWLPYVGELLSTTVLAVLGVNVYRNRNLPGSRRKE